MLFPIPEIKAAFTPLIEELSPAPDPWQACQRLASLPHLLFLDSAGGPEAMRRYSFITADPFRWLQARGRQVQIVDCANGQAPQITTQVADPFAVLQEQVAQFPAATVPGLPPFQGGAAGMFGYDLCHHLEQLPRPLYDEFQTPELAIGFYDWVIAFDHQQNRVWMISTGLPANRHAQREKRARSRLAQLKHLLEAPAPSAFPLLQRSAPAVSLRLTHEVPGLPGLLSRFDRAGYLRTIRRAVEYVHAGDCFQVNIAQRLLYPARIPPLELFGRLRQRNAAPFAGFFDMGEFQLASASPERFVRVGDGHVETRPIKGTRPRGRSSEEDEALAQELLHSAKDRAENVMIVDLLRNDLGRVCRYGSVRVSDVCRLETYRYVHHLVSVVRGQLRERLGPIDLLRASFPGGSVTGAPKVRAMQIITELEQVSRGPYCGCLGYIGFDGSMDTNILIRTFTIGKGWIQFPVGGGIVADSIPEQEYEETWHKAKGSMKALE